MQSSVIGQPKSNPHPEIRELLQFHIEVLERLRDAPAIEILRQAKINEPFTGAQEYRKALNFIKNRDVNHFDINGLIDILKTMEPQALILSPVAMRNLTKLLENLPNF